MRVLSGRGAEAFVRKLEKRGSAELGKVEKTVRRIVDDVRKNGDHALRRYAEKWDDLTPRQVFRVTETELQQSWDGASTNFKDALKVAAANIRQYSQWQKPVEWRKSACPGLELGQAVRPLHSVGCYVPGGRYPLPSTLLMTVIPAQVAGVPVIRVASPRPARETLAAAFFLGVHEFYRVGGAQAIAALAYGTKSVPRVDKIVGPGNLFVTAAKKLVAFDCSIDFLAGPTEVVIVSDAGHPRFIAADLVAQAEHDVDACAVFITGSQELAASVAREIKALSLNNKTAKASLAKNGAILIAKSREQAFEFSNRISPEHITVDEDDSSMINNAGSIFVGDYSPQAAGDYSSGPNHVLPTGGAARFRGGLNVTDFMKTISVQHLSRQGLLQIAPTVAALAKAEGLKAHAESIYVRCPSA
ncbi:MAG TPA: histidinol dehydrogenase [Candidatus Angelobacter sp.]|nr:histidinol dehydrogenase [Candidatus Angelobacter sp.]